jgi:hypothetical protein
VYPSEDKYIPTDTAVAPNGDVYVCDGYGEGWIHRYDRMGDYLHSWSGSGSEPGNMICPHGIWTDTREDNPLVLVADRGNNRIQQFTLVGEHVDFITFDLRQPCCSYGWKDEMYIPDLQSRVTKLDRNNDLICHVGDRPGFWRTEGWPNIPEELWERGAFSSPHGCVVDSSGDLYVAEWISCSRVTKLKRLG